jgi:hypothetical protein
MELLQKQLLIRQGIICQLVTSVVARIRVISQAKAVTCRAQQEPLPPSQKTRLLLLFQVHLEALGSTTLREMLQ